MLFKLKAFEIEQTDQRNQIFKHISIHFITSIDPSIDPHRLVGSQSVQLGGLTRLELAMTIHNLPWSSSATESGQVNVLALNSESLHVASIHFRMEETATLQVDSC